jgi:hypothetical protein
MTCIECHPGRVEGSPDGITVLTEGECWGLVDAAEVGRLAVAVAGEPESGEAWSVVV